MEEELSKLRTIYNNTPDAWLLLDLDEGIIFDCNPAAEKLLGGHKEEIIGKTPDEISPEYQPNGMKSIDLAQIQVKKALEQGSYHFEWTHSKIDGTPFVCDVTCAPMTIGSKNALLGCLRDITKVKELERLLSEEQSKFKTLYENSPDAYLIMELEGGKITDCNPATEKMLKGHRDDILGLTPDDLSPEFQENGRPSKELVAENIIKILKDGHYRFNWIHKRLNGEEFPCDINISLVDLGSRKVLLVGWRDMTEFRKQRTKLIQANEELEQFAYRSSHDLKAPLLTIKGLAKFIIQDIDSGDITEAKDNVFKIYQQSSKLAELVDDILTLARTDLEKQEYSQIRLEDLIKEIETSFSDLIKEKQVQCNFQFESDLVIYTQASRLKQILSNLLGNAIKYSDPNKEIRFVNISCKSGDWISFTIKDNGVGIKKSNQNRLFELFTRFNPELAEGSGLGMSIVKKNVDALNGNISFTSANSGTTFIVNIPKIDEKK